MGGGDATYLVPNLIQSGARHIIVAQTACTRICNRRLRSDFVNSTVVASLDDEV